MWLSSRDAKRYRGAYDDPAATIPGWLPLRVARSRRPFCPRFEIRTRLPFHWRYERLPLDPAPLQFLLFLFAFYVGRVLIASLSLSMGGDGRGIPLWMCDYVGPSEIVVNPDGSMLAPPALASCEEKRLGIGNHDDMVCLRVLPDRIRVEADHGGCDFASIEELLRTVELASETTVVVRVDPATSYSVLVHALDELQIHRHDSGRIRSIMIAPAGVPAGAEPTLFGAAGCEVATTARSRQRETGSRGSIPLSGSPCPPGTPGSGCPRRSRP